MILLFLDIDGVINTPAGELYSEKAPYKRELDPICLTVLEHLVLDQELDIQIVISSTWRINKTIDQLKEILGPRLAPKVIGKTPTSMRGYRGKEIKSYLDHEAKFLKNVEDIIILDDDSDMNPLMGHLFCTDAYNGLTFRDYFEIRKYLRSSKRKKAFTRFKKKVLYNIQNFFWRSMFNMKLSIRDVASFFKRKE